MTSYKKILNLIDSKNKKYLLFLVFLSCISVILETFSIAVVIPLVSIIIQPDFLLKYKGTKFDQIIPDFFYDVTHGQLMIMFLILFGVTFLLKNIYLLINDYFVASFSNKLKANLTNRLLDRYLFQDYLFHVNKKYSNFLASLTTEAAFLVNGIINPLIVLFTEILLILLLVFIIIIFQLYKVILVFGIFFLMGFLLIKVIKKFSVLWGKLREQEEKIRLESLNKLLSGIRDVILIGKKKNLLEKFSFSEKNIAKYNIKNNLLLKTPKYVFETMGVFGLVISIIILKKTGSSTFEILTVASFFVATSYRAIPSINKILQCYQTIKYYFPVVDLLNNELSLSDKVSFSDEKINFKNELRLENISFKYPNTENNVLEDVNLFIKKGSITGIIGTTGSGKSTLIDLISGLIKYNKGKMYVDGIELDTFAKIRNWQNTISYVSQNTYLMDDTIKNNIGFGLVSSEIDKNLINKSIQNSQLDDFINTLPNKINTYVGERGVSLSGGQIQRIGIARAIYRNSDFLILDEITSSLDKDTETKIMQKITNNVNNQTILVVTHNSDLLKYCDDVYKIENKKLIKLENN